MAQRGGKRPGAGRKKGTPNKATLERQKRIAESGQTPLDYMLSVMRDENNPRDIRLDAANKAAPYVHPKLANVDHTSSDKSMSPKPDRIIIEGATVADGKDTATT